MTPPWREVALVALGGAVGTAGRLAVEASVGTVDRLPAGTLAVNLVGALLLGVLVGRAVPTRVRLLVGTGVMGGFTTYSTFAVESARLVGPDPSLAVAYVLGTVAGGYALSLLGLDLGRRLRRRAA